MSMCDLLRSLFRHSLHLITLAGKFSGCTLDRKQCVDKTGSESLWLVVSVSPL